MALREGGYRGHLTAGGHFGTFAAEELLRDFHELDSICRYEAEETLVELVREVHLGVPLELVRGVSLRGPHGGVTLSPARAPPALDRLPRPLRFGEPTRCLGHNIAAMIASRGCYARCAFCCIAAWHEATLPGKRYRLRPVADVADEMASLVATRGVDTFVFHDDNFFLPRPADSLARIEALGHALDARGGGRVATVVNQT